MVSEILPVIGTPLVRQGADGVLAARDVHIANPVPKESPILEPFFPDNLINGIKNPQLLDLLNAEIVAEEEVAQKHELAFLRPSYPASSTTETTAFFAQLISQALEEGQAVVPRSPIRFTAETAPAETAVTARPPQIEEVVQQPNNIPSAYNQAIGLSAYYRVQAVAIPEAGVLQAANAVFDQGEDVKELSQSAIGKAVESFEGRPDNFATLYAQQRISSELNNSNLIEAVLNNFADNDTTQNSTEVSERIDFSHSLLV